jgi:hypothetical protein
MSLQSLYLNVAMGFEVPLPIPQTLALAIQSIDIRQTTLGLSSCQISFTASRTKTSLLDYDVLALPYTQLGNRTIITAMMDLRPVVLFDGLITQRDVSYEDQSRGSSVTLMLNDVSVAMNLTEHSREFPAMSDAEIVGLLLLEYAQYGLLPEVIPVPSADIPSIPLERVPQQNSTDLDYIRALAAKHGCYFYIQPGPAPGTNRAYWGPPKLESIPQPPLRVNMASRTNVQQAQFSYDPLQATRITGNVQDEDAENADLPVKTVVSTRLPLALKPATLSSLARTTLYNDPRYGELQAETAAQSITDISADNASTNSVTVDTLRYGHIVEKGGLIGVSGAGFAQDGFYLVSEVQHTIRRNQYTQTITLTRGGEDSTTPDVL